MRVKLEIFKRFDCPFFHLFLTLLTRYRWNNMPRLEKVYLKNNVMGLISSVSAFCSLMGLTFGVPSGL